MTGPVLREAVSRLPRRIRHPAGVHFGWWDTEGTELSAVTAKGKGVRPALALGGCAAVGGSQAAGASAAVVVELVHNASLLHDDVLDGDRIRRGRPALWAQMGVPAAVLTGDALFFLATQVMATASPSLDTSAGVALLTASVQDLIEGEYADSLLVNETGASLEEVQAMAAGKTGALMAAACALGALVGGGDGERVAHLRAFGAHLGAAFQLVDDLLGIWGDPQRTGKPVGSDLAARKKTLPVVAALGADGPAAHRLRALYARSGPLSTAEQELAARLVEQAGGRAWARSECEQHTAQALEHLHSGRLEPSAVEELIVLARLLTNRDH
ncbi:polyprenyl synthetase family protein [Streptomyces sp. DG2A-72]|uniref:polyprenyl synthetase family protein n=1 Tax=Streptomyces sp. DG2A-72 TaxID=3051386 RepID=UPI00265C156A|nr:polyprenyl synthetase family protein [Streptomyces sp. DG2A-72]MDO0930770.1 polyprenyl synthetase family protein [Streptomyces sp. DG2A-72]